VRVPFYEALGRLVLSPVVDFNRAVAVSMVLGPVAVVPIVDGLVAAGGLASSHLLLGVRRGLTRLGCIGEAYRGGAVRPCGSECEGRCWSARWPALADRWRGRDAVRGGVGLTWCWGRR
jgi:hypothetical protein